MDGGFRWMFYYGCVVLGKDVDSEYREKCKDFCS